MSVRRETAEAFRAHGERCAAVVAEYLRDHRHATRDTIWVRAAEALEQLAKQPRSRAPWLKAKVRELGTRARQAGTLTPALRARERPIATACLRLRPVRDVSRTSSAT